VKIAVFASNYPPHPGGLERVVHHVAAGLADRHEVVVVTTAWAGLTGEAREGNLRVFRLPTIHASEPWGVPYPVPYGPGIRAALKTAGGADVYHAHGALYATSVLAALLARRSARPLVLTEHVGFVQYGSSVLNGIERLAWSTVGKYVLRRTAAVGVLSSRVRDWFEADHPETRLRFIPNGVDSTRFRPRPAAERSVLRARLGLPQNEMLALFVGRHAEKKNLDVVLDVPRADHRLVVCGAPRDLSQDRVIDLGVVPYETMPDLFAAVDLMVHASTGEGFPLAIQEAMASGLPLVVLWDEGYGQSLDRSAVLAVDSLGELEGALLSLVADEGLRRKLGEAGRRWAELNWGWDHTVSEYERLMSDAIGRVHVTTGGSR
jgi:glycosyltransferase involved in cell wall biosynthesis